MGDRFHHCLVRLICVNFEDACHSSPAYETLPGNSETLFGTFLAKYVVARIEAVGGPSTRADRASLILQAQQFLHSVHMIRDHLRFMVQLTHQISCLLQQLVCALS